MQLTINLTDFYYFLAGILFASIVFLFYANKIKKELKSLKRQYEKKSIGADDSSLRVKTLENKIKTLETALKKQAEK